MTKEKWIQHIEMSENLVRPSILGNNFLWAPALKRHQDTGCGSCKDRQATRNRNKNARDKREVYESLGLKRVTGELGGVYYE